MTAHRIGFLIWPSTKALTLALAAGAPLRTSAELANHAAGIVVGKLGTAAVSRMELEAVLRNGHG